MYYDSDDDFILTNNNNEYLIISKDYINKFFYDQEVSGVINWDNLTYIKGSKVQTTQDIDLDNLFAQFKLFKDKYTRAKNSASFKKLLEIQSLDNYWDLFVNSLGKKGSRDKLIGFNQQKDLNKIYDKLLQDDRNLNAQEPCSVIVAVHAKPLSMREEHYTKICETFGLNHLSYSDKDKAQTLLLLSGIFAKLSSANYFGTEDNSPIALRYYAYALMKKAHAIDQHIFMIKDEVSGNPIDGFDQWTNKLLGINGAFTCTAILSNMIIAHCKGFNNTKLLGIIPPAWQ